MAELTLNILIVEEDANDFVLLNGYLNKSFKNPAVVYCPFLEKAVEINAAMVFDVLIISLKPEQRPEKELLNKLLKKANHPTVIILTDDADDEGLAIKAIQAGAQDCIRKENLNSQVLYKSITYGRARRARNVQEANWGHQYQNLFNRNPLPLLVYELDNKKPLLVNEAAERFYGYSSQEFAGMTILDLQQKNDAKNSTKSFAGERKHINKNGEVMEVEVLTSLIQLNNKTCRLAVIIDLAKRSSLQQTNIIDETQQQLLLLQSAINNSADGVIITKAGTTDFYSSEIVYSNAAFSCLTGYTVKETVGQKPELLHKKHPVKEVSAANQFTGTFETCLINYKNNLSDYWVDYSISPVEDEHGNITHFVAVYRDVSVRKSNEAENENLVRELQESNHELKQFSYVIAHNLRAPLANLTGLLSLLETETIEDTDTLELIEAVKSSTNNLNITVNDIIDILMIKSEDDKNPEPLAIAEVWNKVKASLSYLIEAANAQMEEDFTEAPVVQFKESYLESVLLNLLSNALKYRSEERGLTIHIKTYQEQGNVVLIFEDNGIGIDLNKHGHQLFGLYKRFSNKAEGKGLGLYIVQSQIIALGGKIEVKSELNKGTRFTVFFKNKQ